jgi:hypothetical protein
VGVRASMGGRFAPGGANGGRRGSVADARAREERPRRVFIDAGGRLGCHGVNHVTGAPRRGQQGVATCGGAAVQWRATVGTPASGKQPLGAVQALTNVTNSSTPGAAHGPLGPPVPQRARAACVRRAGMART